MPSRGQYAAQTEQARQAIDLALRERAGVAGRWRVEHVALDGGSPETGDWTAPIERANAEAAIADPSVIAYIGPYNSGAAGVSLPLTSRAGLVEFGVSTGWPGLTVPGWNPGEPDLYRQSGEVNFLRLFSPDSMQAEAAATLAQEVRLAPVAVLDDGSTYSTGMARTFIESAGNRGVEVSGRWTLAPTGVFAPAEPIGQSKALFYAPSTARGAVALAKALGADGPPVISTDVALDPALSMAAGSTANWYVLSQTASENVGSAMDGAFHTAFLAAYGKSPGLIAANSYDAASIVLDAVAAGASDRLAVLKYARSVQNRTGASGAVAFDQQGDRIGWEVGVYRLDGGKFRLDRVLHSGR